MLCNRHLMMIVDTSLFMLGTSSPLVSVLFRDILLWPRLWGNQKVNHQPYTNCATVLLGPSCTSFYPLYTKKLWWFKAHICTMSAWQRLANTWPTWMLQNTQHGDLSSESDSSVYELDSSNPTRSQLWCRARTFCRHRLNWIRWD